MSAGRPFADEDALLAAARRAWGTLDRADWLEAFAAHPKIGDLQSLAEKYPSTARWAAGEQAGAAQAAQSTLEALASRNQAYAARFGYIFIVCATGKSAEEMLAILEKRLANRPEDEILIAAAQQEKITEIRLRKL